MKPISHVIMGTPEYKTLSARHRCIMQSLRLHHNLLKTLTIVSLKISHDFHLTCKSYAIWIYQVANLILMEASRASETWIIVQTFILFLDILICFHDLSVVTILL